MRKFTLSYPVHENDINVLLLGKDFALVEVINGNIDFFY
jgi:hypothetical protein